MLKSGDSPLLHDFYVVCRKGNLSLAAQSLNTVQSAVTQRMQRLEKAVGTKLLNRHSRGVTPTEQGLILLKYAKRLNGLIADAAAEIEDWESSPGGPISIGLPPSVSAVATTPLIKIINTSLPKVELTVAEAFSGYLSGWLENDEIDFAFVFNQLSTADIVVYPLLEEELFLITVPETASQLPTPITLRQIVDLPLISPSKRHGLRTGVDEAASQQNLKLNFVLEVDAGNQLIRQILRGAGSAILARSAVKQELSDGVLVDVPIVQPTFKRTVGIAMKKEKSSSYLLQKAQQQIIKLVFELADNGAWPATTLPWPAGSTSVDT